MAQAKANGITIEYEMSGPADAPVLLMIHGVGAQLIRWPQALIDLADLDPAALDWARNQTPQTAKALRLDDPFEINQGHIERLAAGFVCGQPGQLVVPYLQVPS